MEIPATGGDYSPAAVFETELLDGIADLIVAPTNQLTNYWHLQPALVLAIDSLSWQPR